MDGPTIIWRWLVADINALICGILIKSQLIILKNSIIYSPSIWKWKCYLLVAEYREGVNQCLGKKVCPTEKISRKLRTRQFIGTYSSSRRADENIWCLLLEMQSVRVQLFHSVGMRKRMERRFRSLAKRKAAVRWKAERNTDTEGHGRLAIKYLRRHCAENILITIHSHRFPGNTWRCL